MNLSHNLNTIFGKTVSSLLPRFISVYGKQRLSILIYHRVLAHHDGLLSTTLVREDFDWHMEVLARFFNPLSLSEALLMMDEERLPERAVCVTFDDGYADNESVALPILNKWRVPATVFVASGFLEGGRMWNDTVIEGVRALAGKSLDLREQGLGFYNLSTLESQQLAIVDILRAIKHWAPNDRSRAVDSLGEQAGKLPTNLMLTKQQLLNLSHQGVEIGGHTVTHPILAALDDVPAKMEINQNKLHLEEILDKPVRFFAYPNGRLGTDYTLIHREIVKQAGYKAAVSTHRGVVSAGSDRWQMARFTPWDKTPQRFLIRLLLNSRQLVSAPESTLPVSSSQ